ncbi:MAG: hypothetical protein KGH64_00655 [Candidatus Micrarchaeota archaeon]|nr:hypothetical protein [Candidatus Micrarchaeota archaeon]
MKATNEAPTIIASTSCLAIANGSAIANIQAPSNIADPAIARAKVST